MAMRAVRNKSQIETDGADVYPQQPRSVPKFEDDDYKQFVYLMPFPLQQEIIDALIICSPKDIEAAQNFKNHLANDIRYKFEERLVSLNVRLLDDIENLQECFEDIFERSTYTFLFLTQSFLEEHGTLWVLEACLRQTFSDRSKKWSLIPVHTNPIKKRNYKMPLLLQSLKPIEFIRGDPFYKDSMVKMFTSKADERDVRINRKRREYYFQHKETLIKRREEDRKSATNIDTQGQQIKPKVPQSYSKVETDSPFSQRLSSNVLQRRQNERDSDFTVPDYSSRESTDSNNLPSNFEHSTSIVDQNRSSVHQSSSNDISSTRVTVSSSDSSNVSLHYDLSENNEIEDNFRPQTKHVHIHNHIIITSADNIIIGDNGQMTINKNEHKDDEERKSCSPQFVTDDHRNEANCRPSPNVQCASDNSEYSDDQCRASIVREGFPDMMYPFSGASREDELNEGPADVSCNDSSTPVKFFDGHFSQN